MPAGLIALPRYRAIFPGGIVVKRGICKQILVELDGMCVEYKINFPFVADSHGCCRYGDTSLRCALRLKLLLHGVYGRRRRCFIASFPYSKNGQENSDDTNTYNYELFVFHILAFENTYT